MYSSPGGTRTFALLSNATNCPLPDILTSATRKSLSIPIGPCPAPSEVYKVDFTSIEAYNTHLFLWFPWLCVMSTFYPRYTISQPFLPVSRPSRFFIHLWMDSWFSSHVLWIVMLLCAQVSRKLKFLLSPLGSKPWNRIARYSDNPLQNSLRGLHGVFHNCCVLIFPSHPQPTEVLVLPQPPQHLTVSVLSNSSHRDCYKVTACAGSKTCPPPHTPFLLR